jgi:hypothetical protein
MAEPAIKRVKAKADRILASVERNILSPPLS